MPQRIDTLLKFVKSRSNQIFEPDQAFCIASSQNNLYEVPDLDYNKEFINEIEKENPKIILVSASGASGKTELAKYTSFTKVCPLFLLSEYKPVAADTLVGLIHKKYPNQGTDMINGLKNGQDTILIDAIDEGKVKTTNPGFDAFLEDIFEISSKSQHASFVIFGRTKVLDDIFISSYLKQINCLYLNILPLDAVKAKSYILKRLGNDLKHLDKFDEALDLIFRNLRGFFSVDSTNQENVSIESAYSNFIGYPPVLNAIISLLESDKNYQSLINSLNESNHSGMKLIIEIIEKIMNRDRDKIYGMVRDLMQQSKILNENIDYYSIKEQCHRLIEYHTLGTQDKVIITGNDIFDNQYNDRILGWISEHPFLSGSKIQNQVFQSYIIATCTFDEKLHSYADLMLDSVKLDFTFFLMYSALYELRGVAEVPAKFFPKIYNSLMTMYDTDLVVKTYIDDETENSNTSKAFRCEIDIHKNNQIIKTYNFKISSNDNTLSLFGLIENIEIEISGKVELTGLIVDIKPNTSINCSELIIKSRETVFRQRISNSSEEYISIECNKIEMNFEKDFMPEIIIKNPGIVLVNINYNPLAHYFKDCNVIYSQSNDHGIVAEKYQRLRKIALSLRSHGKGSIARFKDKINSNRTLRDELGRKVLQALLEDEILKEEEIMYVLDREVANRYLNISWSDLRTFKTSKELTEYLNKIEV